MRALWISVFAAMLCISNIRSLRGSVGDPNTTAIMVLGGIPGRGGQPSPQEMSANWQVIRRLPLNVITYNISNNGGYFVYDCMTTKKYEWSQLANDVNLMKSMAQERPDLKFVPRFDVSAALTADWYDDDAWKIILSNISLASKAAAAIGATGFCLDNEQYHGQPFNYTTQARRTEKTFEEYNKQVLQRGRQFAAAMCEYVPRAKLLIFFSNSIIAKTLESTASLAQYPMGLWPAFFDGMMEGAPQAEILDGHEDYDLRSYAEFQKARELIKAKGAIFSKNPTEYKKRVKAVFPVWLHGHGDAYPDVDDKDFSRNYFTPEEFKYAVHYAMLNSDGYIWLYMFPWLNAPEAYREALSEARKPLPLDFTFRVLKESSKPKLISAKGRADCNDEVVFASLRKTCKELYDFPKQWSFKLDPQNKGTDEKWYNDSNSSDFGAIRISDWWDTQLNAGTSTPRER